MVVFRLDQEVYECVGPRLIAALHNFIFLNPYLITPSSFPTLMKAAIALSKSAILCAAEI